MNNSYRPNIDSFKQKNEKKLSQFCSVFGYPVMPAVSQYSMDHFGVVLCRDDQKRKREYKGGKTDTTIL